MSDVLLSICIPTYNRAEIVYECVKKCLENPYDWIEVAVTDNCSTDNTMELLSTIADARLKIYKNDKNIGYENLTKCLLGGNGKYCLLLGDEDELVDVDWEKVKSQLQNMENISLFQFHYTDENKRTLVECPKKIYQRDRIETYKKILYSFGFAGAMAIKSEVLKKVWDEAYKTPYLWSLYSETIIPMYCAIYGNYGCLSNIRATRTKRNNKGTMDTNAWKGADSFEPYWSIESRRKQNLEWIEFASHFSVDAETRKKLAIEIILKQLREILIYYYILHMSPETNEIELFLKCRSVIERDRKKTDKEWKDYFKKIYREIKFKYETHFTDMLTFRMYVTVYAIYLKFMVMFVVNKMPKMYSVYRKMKEKILRRK